MTPATVANVSRLEKKRPSIAWGTKSRSQPFQAELQTAFKTPRIAISPSSRDIAPPLGTPIKTGMSAIGNHNNCAGNQLATAITLRRLTFSTSQIAGIWMICIMNGIAARIPIWKLFAPSARAKAARRPLVVMLLKPRETVPSQVSQRSPVAISCSEIVGLGLNNLSGFMLSCLCYTTDSCRDWLIISCSQYCS